MKTLDFWAPYIPHDLAPHRRTARAMLYQMLTNELKLPKGSYHLGQDRSGRPVLESDEQVRLPSVSLTHSGGWVGCAVRVAKTDNCGENLRVTADQSDDLPFGPADAIGLDLELAKAGRDHLQLAAAAFGPREVAAVRRGGSTAFYRIWTLREAWSKATGLGLAGVIDRQDRVPYGLLEDTSSSPTITEPGWRWWSARLLPELHIALVNAWAPVNSEPLTGQSLTMPELWGCQLSPELDLAGISFRNANRTRDGKRQLGPDDATP